MKGVASAILIHAVIGCGFMAVCYTLIDEGAIRAEIVNEAFSEVGR